MKRLTPVVVLIAGLVLSACGSDKESAATSTTTAATATTTSEPAYTGDSGSRFCQLASEVSQRFQNLGAALQGDAETLRGELNGLKAVVDEAKASAPRDVKGDVDTLSSAFDRFFDQVEVANYDPRTAAAAIAKFGSPEIQTAGAHLQAYGQQVCGIDTPSSTP